MMKPEAKRFMQIDQGSDLQPGMEKAETAQADASPSEDAPRHSGACPCAHDFSNLATTVVSAANLLHRYGDDPARVAQIAKLLRETGERAIAAAQRLRPRE